MTLPLLFNCCCCQLKNDKVASFKSSTDPKGYLLVVSYLLWTLLAVKRGETLATLQRWQNIAYVGSDQLSTRWFKRRLEQRIVHPWFGVSLEPRSGGLRHLRPIVRILDGLEWKHTGLLSAGPVPIRETERFGSFLIICLSRCAVGDAPDKVLNMLV